MVLIHDHNSVAAAVSVSIAMLSAVSCLSVISSIILYPRTKESYHLQLVNRLLICDLGLSLCIVVYYFVQFGIDGDALDDFCKIYFPGILYFFIAGYGYTTNLALRFRTMHGLESRTVVWKPPVPLIAFWLYPLIFAFPVLVGAWVTGNVTVVHSNSQNINQICTFNHDSIIGETMDIVCFQLPLLLTILVNTYFYAKGVLALRNSPHSVVARQMRRAGGYLLVLLLVWLPNICYNVLSIFIGNNDSFSKLLDVAVLLTSAQGVLDVSVYVWSNGKMRRWLRRNLACLRLLGLGKTRRELQPSIHSSINDVNGGGKIEQLGPDSDDEEEGDQTMSMQDSLRNSSHTHDLIDAHLSPLSLRIQRSQQQQPSSQVTTVHNPVTSDNIDGIKRPSQKVKSILIPTSTLVNGGLSGGARPSNNLGNSLEFDQEKFVRFGE